MSRLGARRLATAGFAFLCLGLGPAPAGGKLRIYMQDGSLQAGNLVTETTEAFVVLTKEGRVELPKKNIMFINGKTLKQWEERPDKLFQTEIMPSELPNPAFVNDKAPLPRPPENRSVQNVAPPPAPAVKAAAAPPAPAPKAVPAAPVSIPAALPADDSKPATPKSRRKRKQPAVETAKATAPVVPAAVAVAPAEPSAAPKRAGNRRLQARSAKGAWHRERGFDFLKSGEQGRAQQDLLIARLLEPDNGDTYLALARMNREAGLFDQALKYLGHWTLRKNDVAAREIVEINAEIELRKKNRLYLQIIAVSGSFAWLPVVLLMRWIRRRRPKPVVVDADAVIADEAEVAGTKTAPIETPAWVKETEAVFSETDPSPVAPPPPMTPIVFQKPVEPEPPVIPEPIAAPEPVAFAPEPAPIVPEPVVETPPPVEPVVVPEPVVEAPLEPAPEPELESERDPEPELVPEPLVEEEPEAAPLPVDVPPDPREILAMARSVENALVRGNAAAAEGRLDEARRFYRTAIALNADCATAHLGLGFLAFCEEKWDTSLLHYRKALEIDPASADAHYGAARVLLEINRVDEAVPELRATLTIDPTYDDARDALTAIGKPA